MKKKIILLLISLLSVFIADAKSEDAPLFKQDYQKEVLYGPYYRDLMGNEFVCEICYENESYGDRYAESPDADNNFYRNYSDYDDYQVIVCERDEFGDPYCIDSRFLKQGELISL